MTKIWKILASEPNIQSSLKKIVQQISRDRYKGEASIFKTKLYFSRKKKFFNDFRNVRIFDISSQIKIAWLLNKTNACNKFSRYKGKILIFKTIARQLTKKKQFSNFNNFQKISRNVKNISKLVSNRDTTSYRLD